MLMLLQMNERAQHAPMKPITESKLKVKSLWMHPHDYLIQPATIHTHDKKKRQGWGEPIHK